MIDRFVGESICTSGATVSTLNVTDVSAALVALSIALTSTVWSPSTSPAKSKLLAEVTTDHSLPSMRY